MTSQVPQGLFVFWEVDEGTVVVHADELDESFSAIGRHQWVLQEEGDAIPTVQWIYRWLAGQLVQARKRGWATGG